MGKFNKIAVMMFVMSIVLVALSIIIGYRDRLKLPTEPISTKVDTLVIRDTITHTEAIYVNRWKTDSVLVPVTDTLRMHDTLYVLVEKHQIEWADSLSVVYASGIQVNIDSVKHFTERMVIHEEVSIPVKVKNHWGLGVQAGYGVGYANGKVSGIPYIGVGVSYNILTW